MSRHAPGLVGAGFLLAIVLVAAASPAVAQEPEPQPSTTTTTTTTTGYVPTGEADELELSPLEAAVLNSIIGDGELPNPCTQTGGDVPSVDASIVPDDCWGPFPSSHYDIGCDEGAWNHISRKVYCTLTDLAFQGGRSATAVALWLIGWSYGFGVYDQLGPPAIGIAETYQTDLIGPIGLGHLAWLYAVAWAAITALRGRLTMAAGELLTSIVLAGLAGVLLANPAGYLRGTLDTTGTVSGALLATGSGQPPPEDGLDAAAVLAPLQEQLHRAFVEDPYDHLNWGGPPTGECLAMRDRIVAAGPHGNSDGPREAMHAAGCDTQADFNHDPNGSRLFGAALTFGAALVMVTLIALVALTIVVAQVVLVVLFALVPFAALAAILPGAGRELAWRWVAALLRVLLAVIGMSFVLSLLLLTVRALLEASTDVGLIERFALVNMVVLAMFVARRRIMNAGHNLAASLGQRLAARRFGGERAAPWLAAPALAGATGFGLGASIGPDRATRTSRLASAAGRSHLANRRVRHQTKAADRRAQRRVDTVTARERTEIHVDDEGHAHARHAISVDGPAATSRRARAARARLEARTQTGFAARQEAHRGRHAWGHPASGDDNPADGAGTQDGNDRDVTATPSAPRRQNDQSWVRPDPGPPPDEPIDVEET